MTAHESGNFIPRFHPDGVNPSSLTHLLERHLESGGLTGVWKGTLLELAEALGEHEEMQWHQYREDYDGVNPPKPIENHIELHADYEYGHTYFDLIKAGDLINVTLRDAGWTDFTPQAAISLLRIADRLGNKPMY